MKINSKVAKFQEGGAAPTPQEQGMAAPAGQPTGAPAPTAVQMQEEIQLCS